MNQSWIAKVLPLSALVVLGFFMAGCATTKEGETMSMDEEMPMQEEMATVETYPADYVFPLSKINLENVIEENQGMKILKENATTVRDYYRGGVQEKAEGEKLLTEGKWEEAMSRFIKSNRFLEVVLDYLPEDEPYRNIYGNHHVIFMPNLLIADNQLKLLTICRKLELDEEIYWVKKRGKGYLDRSLRSVKTEWASQIRKQFETEE